LIRAVASIAASLTLFVQASSVANAASIVTEWLDEALPAAKEIAWEPTVGSRFLAILNTATYDAWTAYDPVAVGVASGITLKNRGGPSNEANKREAISHAAYTVLRILAPPRQHALIDRMTALGYDPNAHTAAAEVGRSAALGVLAMRREDGSNETGDFADTTGYTPRDSGGPDAWRPIAYFGKRQLPTTPQWSRVLPFALMRADQFRSVPPPAPGTAEWARQIQALISVSGALTDSEKAAAEYWGICGMAPAPQLIEMTKFVSSTNDLRLDDDVKLFFVASNAILDASIATWDEKYFYDYVRPVTAIHALGDALIKAWQPGTLPTAFAYSTPLTRASAYSALPAAGIGEMRAAKWEPYLPTPPFPAYVSGHSAFTAAWARVMELMTGKPDFNFRETVRRLYVEQRELTQPVTLFYPTFASAAEASGASRIFGGIHWPADNERGQELGRKVGENAWRRAMQFVLGTASPATAIFATLRPPLWFYDNEGAGRPTDSPTRGGIAIDLPSVGAGVWRSVVVDAMPAGAYELKLRVTATGDQTVSLKASVEAGEQSNSVVLGATEAIVPTAGPASIMTVPWTSDGVQSFRVLIEAHTDNGSGRVLVSDMNATRIWPMVAGSPRYYEMSSASLPGQQEEPEEQDGIITPRKR
jgi:PAP2 superfamily